MIQAYAYLRVSGKGQIDGDGFPRQEASIRDYAAGNQIEIAGVYRERGVSGTVDSMDRPTWAEMIAAMLTSGVRMIVIEKLDRLARDLMLQEHILIDLKDLGIEIISTAEPDMCNDDPTRILMRQIMGAIAQYDKTMIVLKLRGARRRKKAATGRCEGAKPFGDLPGERPTLEAMRYMRSQKMTIESITGILNAEGKYARCGKSWFPSAVSRILRRSA